VIFINTLKKKYFKYLHIIKYTIFLIINKIYFQSCFKSVMSIGQIDNKEVRDKIYYIFLNYTLFIVII